MSFDLEYWYQINPKYPDKPLNERLEVRGAGHSESNMGLSRWDADENATFEEQVELMLVNCPWLSEEEKMYFRELASEFKASAEAKDRIIKSHWI